MQPTTDRRAVHRDVVNPVQFLTQLIQRQIAALGQARPRPAAKLPQLAHMPRMALPLRLKRARLATQLDHVIHEFRRNPEVTRRFSVPMPIIDKGNNTLSQLYRMWLSHR